MVCKFGFTYHPWFCPGDLTHVKKSNILKNLPVCDRCELKFHNEYLDFKDQDPIIWKYSFEDFLKLHIEERLWNLKNIWDRLYVTANQYEKFSTIFESFMDYNNSENVHDKMYKQSLLISLYHSLYQQRGNSHKSSCNCNCCDIMDPNILTINYFRDSKVFCYNCSIRTEVNDGLCSHVSPQMIS